MPGIITVNKLMGQMQWRVHTRIWIPNKTRNYKNWTSIPHLFTSLIPGLHSLRACEVATLFRWKRCTTESNLIGRIAYLYVQHHIGQRWRQRNSRNKRLSECFPWKFSNRPQLDGSLRFCSFWKQMAHSALFSLIGNWNLWLIETRTWYCTSSKESGFSAAIRCSQHWKQTADISSN